MKIDVDDNLVLTAMLLCNCKKVENAQKMGKLETFAKEGAEYSEHTCQQTAAVGNCCRQLPAEAAAECLYA